MKEAVIPRVSFDIKRENIKTEQRYRDLAHPEELSKHP
jgi:hypothetical protein